MKTLGTPKAQSLSAGVSGSSAAAKNAALPKSPPPSLLLHVIRKRAADESLAELTKRAWSSSPGSLGGEVGNGEDESFIS